jgi:hypothetical protein
MIFVSMPTTTITPATTTTTTTTARTTTMILTTMIMANHDGEWWWWCILILFRNGILMLRTSLSLTRKTCRPQMLLFQSKWQTSPEIVCCHHHWLQCRAVPDKWRTLCSLSGSSTDNYFWPFNAPLVPLHNTFSPEVIKRTPTASKFWVLS